MSDQRTTPSDTTPRRPPVTPPDAHASGARSAARPGAAPHRPDTAAMAWARMRRQWPRLVFVDESASEARRFARRLWKSPMVAGARQALGRWVRAPYAGVSTLVAGSVVITILLWLSSLFFQVPNLGVIYIPLIAMLA